MNRTIAILLIASMLFVCSGCKSNDVNMSGTTGPTSDEPVTDDPGSVPATVAANEPTTGHPGIPVISTPENLLDSDAMAIDAIASDYGCIGVQAAIIKGGQVRYCYEYGIANVDNNTPVVRDTKYRCASLSKIIVAMTVMAVSDVSSFDIDADISNYLGYEVRNPSFPDTEITPRMLMTHSSSISDSQAFLESRNSRSSAPLEFLLSYGSTYTGSRPGSEYLYSNFGLAVLAAAIETYTGKSFDSLAGEYIFDKIGIDCGFLASDISAPSLIADIYFPGGSIGYSAQSQLHETTCDKPGQTHHIYQGNLTISACDYASLLCILINGGKYRNTSVISDAGVDEILKPQIYTEGHPCGLCVDILDTVRTGREMYCHTGSNFGMYSSFAFYMASGDGAVVFTSGANASVDDTGLYNVCAQIINVCLGT